MTIIARSLPPLLRCAAGAAGRARARRAARVRLRARVGRAGAGAGRRRWSTSSVATTALQDPHQIQARPSLIARVRNADLVVCTGAELEVGWLPLLLQQSGNAKVQPGQPGNFAGGRPRAQARGARRSSTARRATCTRPAIRTSRPTRATSRWSRRALGARLQQLDPAQRGRLRAARQADFAQRWQQAMRALDRAGRAAARACRWSSQHKGFVYLYDWLGLKEVAVLEPKPGVEPSASHLQRVLATLKAHAGAHGAVRGLPGPAAGRVAVPRTPASRR